MRKKFVDHLFKNRYQSERHVREILEHEAAHRQRTNHHHRHGTQRDSWQGVHKGQFFRLRLPGPSRQRRLVRLPKLRNHASPMMRPFVPVRKGPAVVRLPPGGPHDTGASSSSGGTGWRSYWQRAQQWLTYNCGVLILNFGSICSLLAFTRTDVLELRALSVTGSLSSLVYFGTLPIEQRSWTPIVWGTAFVLVNGIKIRDILEERRAVVQFSDPQQEEIYRRYFLPHGCTPKQFEYIVKRARTIRLHKGDVLVREGAPMKRVFLVTQGATQAHHLGRRLTAVSFMPTTQEYQAAQQGGSHWIGEMSFLEQYWHKQTNHAPPELAESPTMVPRRRTHHPVERAMYTISSVQDGTTVLAWKHAEMESLLGKSSDLRDVLTRALTAGIVGKVVAFTASKKAAASAKPTSWWQGLRPSSGLTTPSATPDPPVTWIEDEEDEPKKVKIDRKPTFALPET